MATGIEALVQQVARLNAEVASMKSRLAAVLTPDGKLRQDGSGTRRQGVLEIHGHAGTGDGGLIDSNDGHISLPLTGVTISGGVFNMPADPTGLTVVTGEGGVDDDLFDIRTNGGSTTLVPGTVIHITNATGDAITVSGSGQIVLAENTDVVLSNAGRDILTLYAVSTATWLEIWRSETLRTTASLTVAGAVELATAGEINTGTDATRAVTPDALAGANIGIRYLQPIIFDFTADCATGDGKFYVHIPPALDAMNLVYVHAEVITAGTTGTMDIQIHHVDNVLDMLSTKLTIDTGETGSDTAATPAVINTANDHVNTNDVLRIDIDAIHTTAAKGLIVTLGFQLA